MDEAIENKENKYSLSKTDIGYLKEIYGKYYLDTKEYQKALEFIEIYLES